MSPKITRSPRVKREPNPPLAHGLITPNISMTSADPNVDNTVVKEDSNVKPSFTPVNAASFLTNRRTPIDLDHDEGYSTQSLAEAEADVKRARRSVSPSLASIPYSRHQTIQPPPVFSLPPRASMAPSIASRMPAPGASLELVGEKVSLLVNAIEELRKLGLKEIDTELPELVLVGDQSAGKSSLMGAIAEINLPKDKGMCTRCPANIKTSSADTWSCTVSLHLEYRFFATTRRIPNKKVPFPPWIDNDTLVVHHFKTISRKSELEDVLRWAQIALLNPSEDYHLFVPGTGAIARNGLPVNHRHEADFSPNIVAIEIAGPRLPALSFYDLPGIFQSAANKDEEYLIRVFENLARKFIKHPKALIICARTMATDPGNCRTITLIREENAQKRTIGVLTMPDRLPDGPVHQDFDKILRKEAHILPRGYFVTKQPGPNFQLHGIGQDYHVQARQEEEAFFSTDARWTGEWKDFVPRCGIGAIQSYLSQEFARLIVGSMPDIEQKINAQIEFVNEQLNHLPDLPNENVQHIVRQSLQEFSAECHGLLNRGSPHSSYSQGSANFLSSWTELTVDFAAILQKIKPMFIYTDVSDQRLEVINLDDSDDDSRSSSVVSLPSRKHAAPATFSTPPSKMRKSINGSGTGSHTLTPGSSQQSMQPKNEFTTPTGGPRVFARPREPASGKKHTPFNKFSNSGKKFMTIAQIRTVISTHLRPGHPDNVPDAALEQLCLMPIGLWQEPLEAFRDETFKSLRQTIKTVLDRSLQKYQKTDLYRRAKEIVFEFLDKHQAEQQAELQKLYDVESYKLFTLNIEVFRQYKREELVILQAARRKHRVQCYVQNHAKLLNKTLSDSEREKQEKAVTGEQLGLDPFSSEITTAAHVRGYYKTAAYRFVDNVCLNILGTLFRKVQDEIRQQMLENALGLNTGDGEQKCRSLIIEDHGEARKRALMQSEKAKLSQAAVRLEKLVTDFGFESEDAEGDVDMYDNNVSEDEEQEESPSQSRRSISLADRGLFAHVEIASPSP